MNARDAVTVVRRMLQQGHDIAPETWRSDPIFRYATIGLGITAGLLLLRLFGPDVPELHAPPRVLPFDRPSVPEDRTGTKPRRRDGGTCRERRSLWHL
jgi:hypothetical protein